jgi:lysophospholipase L1-like esterase
MSSHPWTRYVAIGDSFTEGIGDPDPTVPGGHRGWADHVAQVLATQRPGFAYANLAVRGRLLQQVLDEQVDAALALRPDLVTCSAGGNDILRPGTDPDEVAARLDDGVARLRRDDATVVVFPGPDVRGTPVLSRIRGKIAIFNENVRAVARRRGALVADLWALRELEDPRMWAPDRIHFSPLGHRVIARMVLDTLGAENDFDPGNPGPLFPVSWRQARRDDLGWAREYFAPWVARRVRGRSSGDRIEPKRPTF